MSKEQTLFDIIADILDIENVDLNTVLDPWDSLAMISFIAESGDKFECAISPDDLREAKTVNDLLQLI